MIRATNQMETIMKKLLYAVFCLLFLTSPAQTLASPSSWLIDEDHTAAHFAVEHMGLTMVRGSINDVEGTMVVSEDTKHSVQIEITLDAFSLFTGIKKRDHHLMSPDFLDVAKHPALSFRSTGTSPAGTGSLKMTGDLTIHGITKEVTLLFTGPTREMTDPWGNRRRGGKITGVLKTADFDLNWNRTLATGKMVIGEDIEVILDLEVIMPASK